MIDSEKFVDIVRECRALVLDSSDWSLVSRSYFRFFNLGEIFPNQKDDRDIPDKAFDFDNCIYQTKEDGSLISLYFWCGTWHISTRSSFGFGDVNGSGYTWRDLFEKACPRYAELNPDYTYTFELCTPYSQIVRFYPEPTAYLLTIFKGENELSHNSPQFQNAKELGIRVVDAHAFTSLDQMVEFLNEVEKTDVTFEGFVLRDRQNRRLKAKNLAYLNLHRTLNNGNVVLPKNLIPLIMNSEIDEVLGYFEFLRPEVDKWRDIIYNEQMKVELLWHQYNGLPIKEFALAIKGQTKFTHVLFLAKRSGRPLLEGWTSETVVKTLCG